jgi:predicted RNA-binding protein with PIN domain
MMKSMLSLMIDGYNLLHQMAGRPLDSLEDERMALIEELQKYQSIKQVPVTIVFDGSQPRALFPSRDRFGHVDIVYTDKGISADDWLAERCREHPGSFVVVSNDLEVQRSAENSKCLALSSNDFILRLKAIRTDAAQWDMIPEKVIEMNDDRPLYPKVSTKKKGVAKRLPKRERRKHHQLRQF